MTTVRTAIVPLVGNQIGRSDCNLADYKLNVGGYTALYDAVVDSVEATVKYADTLAGQDYMSNGVVFVITDGMNCAGSMTMQNVRNAIDGASRNEALESLNTILVGVNVTDPQVSQHLSDLNKNGGFSQYVELKDALPQTLAKLANFASRSVSAASQSLGTGGPSKALTF